MGHQNYQYHHQLFPSMIQQDYLTEGLHLVLLDLQLQIIEHNN